MTAINKNDINPLRFGFIMYITHVISKSLKRFDNFITFEVLNIEALVNINC